MAGLRFSECELLSERPSLTPHVVMGRRMHGGFDADGRYHSPRSAGRADAVAAWTDALVARGGSPFPADATLLEGIRRPTRRQQQALLDVGVSSFLWNQLTIVGKIEGQGRLLVHTPMPDLAPHIVEDVTHMALGHLNGGLLRAHGLDEGGDVERNVGGHDDMWFAVRDLAFGVGRHPDVEPPPSISRPEVGRRLPGLPEAVEWMLSLLANLLIIEFRAELTFADTQFLLAHDFFEDRRREADEAIEVVERIRADEVIHVQSLRLYLGELLELTFATDSGPVPARSILEPYWQELLGWATVDQPQLDAERQLSVLRAHCSAAPDPDALWARLCVLDDAE